MADRDRLYDALKQADAAGDTSSAQKLADYIRKLPGSAYRPPAQEEPKEADSPSMFAAKGIGETALQMASASVATPVAGVAGAVSAPFVGGERAAEITQGIQQAGTYQPKTEAGQAISQGIAAPFEALSKGARKAGEVAQDLGASPAVAAGVETAVNLIPALVAKGFGRVVGKAPMSTSAAENIAQQAAKQAGVDWSQLGAKVRKQMVDYARSSTEKGAIPSQAVGREALAGSHAAPISMTRGQALRDPVQMKLEKQLSQTDSGRPIRDVYLEQNKALQENLDILRGKTGAKISAGSTEDQGGAVQKAALAAKAEERSRVRRLYRKADASAEGDAPVPTKDLLKFIDDSVDPKEHGYARSFIERKAAQDPQKAGFVDLRSLERLRSQVSAASREGGTKGYAAGQLLNQIDHLMDQTATGPLYRAARASRKSLGEEFERKGSVRRLVSDKAGTSDRAVALEDTWKRSVLGGSIQDLRNVVKTLRSGGKKQVREMGEQALKEMAGQTVDYIKQEATKGIAPMEGGEPAVGASGFIKAVDRIGRPKLETLIGKESTDELYKLVETAKNVLTEPPSREVGSSTFSNFLRALDHVISRIPIAGPVATGVAKGAARAYSLGKQGQEVRQAVTSPLAERSGYKPPTFRLSDTAIPSITGGERQ